MALIASLFPSYLVSESNHGLTRCLVQMFVRFFTKPCNESKLHTTVKEAFRIFISDNPLEDVDVPPNDSHNYELD